MTPAATASDIESRQDFAPSLLLFRPPLFLSSLVLLSFFCHHQARRFILLVEEMYNHGTQLVALAADDPEKLYVDASNTNFDETFAFARCSSRLTEMETEEYQQKPHRVSWKSIC